MVYDMSLSLPKTLQQRYFLLLVQFFQIFGVRQIRITHFFIFAKMNNLHREFSLNFSVSHKTSLIRTNGITVIAIPRDFKHMVYFLSFFTGVLFNFFKHMVYFLSFFTGVLFNLFD